MCGLKLMLIFLSKFTYASNYDAQLSRRIQGGAAVFAITPHVPMFVAQIKVKIEFSEHTFSPNIRRCGGSVIHHRFVLSAAQCFQPFTQEGTIFLHPVQASDVQVRLGSLQLDEGIRYIIKEINIHPGYKVQGRHYDLALLESFEFIAFSRQNKVIPVRIYTDIQVLGNETMELYGWGVTQYGNNHSVSHLLKKLVVTLMHDSQCAEVGHGRIKTSIEFCATSVFNTGSCYGDAGGPLILNSIQYGVLSRPYTNTEGCLYQPKVYTKVFADVDWLNGVIGEDMSVYHAKYCGKHEFYEYNCSYKDITANTKVLIKNN